MPDFLVPSQKPKSGSLGVRSLRIQARLGWSRGWPKALGQETEEISGREQVRGTEGRG